MKLFVQPKERYALLKSWLVISLAFAIVIGRESATPLWIRTAIATSISAITVGLGFILHELAHKYVAEKERCHAEYKADNTMLIIALATSIFGIIIAAPGAVHISGRPSLAQRGRIAIAGPAANLVLAVLFLTIFSTSSGFLRLLTGYGGVINTWLGLFNMLPFGAFDGAKVFEWNKNIYTLITAAGVLLAFVQIPLGLF